MAKNQRRKREENHGMMKQGSIGDDCLHTFQHRYHANVDCWFCGVEAQVPYHNRNCWDCPSCDQYNGFDEDGGYNKPIPTQYDARLNHPSRCQEDEFLGGDDVLCDRCSQNQRLKIQQLAKFVPFNEKNYDLEVEAFKKQIEKVYILCLTCERKVQQTIQVQDETISKRLSHLDEYRRFLENSHDEQVFLHSSYTDRRLDKYIAASFVFLTLSLVCSILVGAKEISLDGEYAWQKQLLFIHPVLLWLDRNATFLVITGLLTGVLAKFCLGKYRLHIVDALSCPVWLLVFLSQTGFLTIYQTGSGYHICSLLLNFVTSAICLGVNRQRWDKPNLSITKIPMNSYLSDSMSSVSGYSSVTEGGERSRSEARSVNDSPAQVTSTTDPDHQTGFTQKDENTSVPIKRANLSSFTQITRRDDDAQNDGIADTTSNLDAFSLGTPPLQRNNSGMFSTPDLSNQSVSQNLWSKKLGERRPLLSAVKFTHDSSEENHRSSPIPKYGLFSVPVTDKTASFVDRPVAAKRPSVISPTDFFSSQRHSFTPKRPASPVITSFGESPFSHVPLHCDSHSQFSNHPAYRGSFSAARDTSSVAMGFSSVARQRPSVARERPYIVENSDSEDDSFSGITSISRRFSRDRSVRRRQQVKDRVPWYQHPGFVGFILGGSFVANIIFAAQTLYRSAS